jgi:hypothetical protein
MLAAGRHLRSSSANSGRARASSAGLGWLSANSARRSRQGSAACCRSRRRARSGSTAGQLSCALEDAAATAANAVGAGGRRPPPLGGRGVRGDLTEVGLSDDS